MRMLFVVLYLSVVAVAQDAPSPKVVIVSNAAMWASAALNAHATYYGTGQCAAELARSGELSKFGTSVGGGSYHPWRKALTVSVPLDAGASLVSYVLLRRHHRSAAVALPLIVAASQATVATMQYTQGCF